MSVQTKHARIPVARRCELLGLARSSLYYRPRPNLGDEQYNLALMRLMDEQFARTPFYGVRRMRVCLESQGHRVNDKRVRRLMRAMGLAAIYPRPRLTLSNKAHRKYPYLLKGLPIERPNQVWATDITYIRMRRGFVYLTAIMDWASRCVLSWEVSTTLETEFCLTCLERALASCRPEVFNSDQGSQFTSEEFTGMLEKAGVCISMDGRGRVFDNIFIERLWRSVKYEEVFLRDYESVGEARHGIGAYFDFYNFERPHQSLDYATPARIYFGESADTKRGSLNNVFSLEGGGTPSLQTALAPPFPQTQEVTSGLP